MKLKFEQILFADIETYSNDKGEQIPYLIAQIDEKNNEKIYFLEENLTPYDLVNKFMEEIFKKNTLVYFHNLNFDGEILLEYFINRKKKINGSLISRDGKNYSIKLKRNNKTIELRCSYRILNVPLKKLGNLLGTEEKKKIDYESINENNIHDKRYELIEYCRTDILILKDAMVKFREKILNNDIDIFNDNILSISSLSMEIFKKKYNNYNIKTCDKEYSQILRAGYYGGRCEVFGNAYKDEDVYWFDFNSMYPNIMLENKYPVDNPRYILKPKEIKNGVYNIEFYSRNMKIPILPIRLEGRLFFSNSNNIMEGIYTSDEIKLFLENGGVIKDIIWGIEYEKYENVFENFMNIFLKERKKSKENNFIYKLLMNSLYGKFGTHDIEYTIILTGLNDECIKRKKIHNYIEMDSNVIYAMMTTSYGRIKLFNTIKEVLSNEGRILYCDTDSVFASFKKNKIKDYKGKYIDKWNKCENPLFLGPKFYLLNNNESKIKGFSIKDKSILEKIKEMFVEEKKFIKIENQNRFIKNKGITLEKYEKTLELIQTKRIWKNNKKDTDPVMVIFNKEENRYYIDNSTL